MKELEPWLIAQNAYTSRYFGLDTITISPSWRRTASTAQTRRPPPAGMNAKGLTCSPTPKSEGSPAGTATASPTITSATATTVTESMGATRMHVGYLRAEH